MPESLHSGVAELRIGLQSTRERVLFGSGGEPFPQLARVLSWSREAGRPDAVYLGDSVVERVARTDVDRRSLGEMVAEGLLERGLKCETLSHPGYHPEVFCKFAELFENSLDQVRLVLIPVNLRSFSPQWHGNPLYRFEQELNAIDRAIYAPYATPPVIHPIVENDEIYTAYDRVSVHFDLSQRTRLGDFRRLIETKPADAAGRRDRAREIFVFNYTHRLTADHPKVQFLQKAVERFVRMGSTVVVYATPVNWEAGREFVGNEFADRIQENTATLEAALVGPCRSPNCLYVDWSRLFSRDVFFHADFANEHLNEHGRKALAAEILARLLTLGI